MVKGPGLALASLATGAGRHRNRNFRNAEGGPKGVEPHGVGNLRLNACMAYIPRLLDLFSPDASKRVWWHYAIRQHDLMRNIIVIEAGRSERHYWLDLWRYRELFRVLAWRDLSVRYKQTVIGVLWALIRPFLTMLVFTIIFGRIAKLPTDGASTVCTDGVCRHAAMDVFFYALSEASNSLINNANLINKVYFPRLIVPIATIVVAFVDFLISFCILLALIGWYRFWPGLADRLFCQSSPFWLSR